jgi:hypothetical protein
VTTRVLVETNKRARGADGAADPSRTRFRGANAMGRNTDRVWRENTRGIVTPGPGGKGKGTRILTPAKPLPLARVTGVSP